MLETLPCVRVYGASAPLENGAKPVAPSEERWGMPSAERWFSASCLPGWMAGWG